MPELYAKVRRGMNRGVGLIRRGLAQATFRSPVARMTPFDRAILDGLERDGTVVTHVDAMADAGYVGVRDVLRFGPALFEGLNAPLDKGYVVHVPQGRIEASPESLLWGINPRFVDIVEAYLGLPAAYRGMTARRDIANGEQTATRLWHRDGEDARIVKLIVYLNDVECADDGAFEYIPKSALSSTRGLTVFEGNRVSDADIDQMVPKDQQRLCLGRAGTVVLTDTCSVFHKGAVGKRRDRYTLFYPFNSFAPLSPRDCSLMFDADHIRAHAALTSRQAALIDRSVDAGSHGG
jgi:hypothetical protein